MDNEKTAENQQERDRKITTLQRPIAIKAAKNNQERESTEYRIRF